MSTRRQESIILAQDLHKGFVLGDTHVQALAGVNLDVPNGQFIAIMGPSGSGKSTLLYVLGGLDHPSHGAIEVAGHRLDAMSGEDLALFRRNTVGFVFQAFHLIPSMTALQNVALPGVFAGVPVEDREDRAGRLLDTLGLGDRLDHKPSQLSGGQQQRVAIGRALFNNPPIIMADEPTGALDSKTGTMVMRMLRYLSSKQGKTVLIVTHDPNVAAYADRMVMLRDGKIVEDRLNAPEEKLLNA
ncbi:MAG: ABC transporter ATP-binding protein [Chloroflexi bacterium]|nr:ABC transporter ATP-binding protein [Chloroflexota bacterium]